MQAPVTQTRTGAVCHEQVPGNTTGVASSACALAWRQQTLGEPHPIRPHGITVPPYRVDGPADNREQAA